MCHLLHCFLWIIIIIIIIIIITDLYSAFRSEDTEALPCNANLLLTILLVVTSILIVHFDIYILPWWQLEELAERKLQEWGMSPILTLNLGDRSPWAVFGELGLTMLHSVAVCVAFCFRGYTAQHKKRTKIVATSHHTRLLGSKCRPTQNAFAARAPLRTPLGELTALRFPRPPSCIWGPLRGREGRGTGRERGNG